MFMWNVDVHVVFIYFYQHFQARSLCSLHADVDQVGFLIGTQSLNTSNNQVHLVKLQEDTNTLSPQVCFYSDELLLKINSI